MTERMGFFFFLVRLDTDTNGWNAYRSALLVSRGAGRERVEDLLQLWARLPFSVPNSSGSLVGDALAEMLRSRTRGLEMCLLATLLFPGLLVFQEVTLGGWQAVKTQIITLWYRYVRQSCGRRSSPTGEVLCLCTRLPFSGLLVFRWSCAVDWTMMVVVAFSSLARIVWRMFNHSFPACAFFFLSGDYLAHTNSTLYARISP